MAHIHFELHVEDRSMEVFLTSWLPRFLPADSSFKIYSYRGKHALLRKIRSRLEGYANWMPPDHRLVLIVDRDSDDCEDLKAALENHCQMAGLRSRRAAGSPEWQIVTRIAIEELEAWYFGGWEAVCAAYPRVPGSVPNRSAYRDPDAIKGGTWEALQRVLQKAGYFRQGLNKAQVAASIGEHFEPANSRSHSFGALRDAISEAIGRHHRPE